MSILNGATDVTINDGVFHTTVSNTTNMAGHPIRSRDGVVSELLRHSAPAGLLDAKERFPAPQCDKATRISMLQGMRNFVQEDGPPAIYWLHGPAGVGKSALCQSLALKLKEEDDHAASFFFSRTAPGRNDGSKLIATLACQLALNIPSLQPILAKTIKDHPFVFNATNEVKIKTLIIDPINELARWFWWSPWAWAQWLANRKLHPRLILVDGLDECHDPRVQCDLILCIGRAARQIRLPFRFVVASRPEFHILTTFDLEIFQRPDGVKLISKNLRDDGDADEQIRLFLMWEFAEIRRTHPIRQFLPAQWPLPSQIDQLVSKSSKGFIYPATVIRYIKMPKNRPGVCLERILGLSETPVNDKPYEPIDVLYRYIFESVSDDNKADVRNIFHLLVTLTSADDSLTPRLMERYLDYRPGHVQHLLCDLLCIVSVTGIDQPIEILHASLPDFLHDPLRSGVMCIRSADAHVMLIAKVLNTCMSDAQVRASATGPQYGAGSRDQAWNDHATILDVENIIATGSSHSIYWLHGPSGPARSSFAQSLAVSLQCIYVTDSAPLRCTSDHFILSLAQQLAAINVDLRSSIWAAIRSNPSVFYDLNADKMEQLLFKPVEQWKSRYFLYFRRLNGGNPDFIMHPRHILIDGLDECSAHATQLNHDIARAIRRLSWPFRFVFVTGCPEADLLTTLNDDPSFQGLPRITAVCRTLSLTAGQKCEGVQKERDESDEMVSQWRRYLSRLQDDREEQGMIGDHAGLAVQEDIFQPSEYPIDDEMDPYRFSRGAGLSSEGSPGCDDSPAFDRYQPADQDVHTRSIPAVSSPKVSRRANKRTPAPSKQKGIVRTKSGCYTCRIRRKKCDENRMHDGGPCETCFRLKLECLGFGPKRPEWLRESHRVSEIRDRIKAHLASQGMIKGHAGSGARSNVQEDILVLSEDPIDDDMDYRPRRGSGSSSEGSPGRDDSPASDRHYTRLQMNTSDMPGMPYDFHPHQRSSRYTDYPYDHQDIRARSASPNDRSVQGYELQDYPMTDPTIEPYASPAVQSSFSMWYHTIPTGLMPMDEPAWSQEMVSHAYPSQVVSYEIISEATRNYVVNIVKIQYPLGNRKSLPEMIWRAINTHLSQPI